MTVKNRLAAAVFRLIMVVGCSYGLYLNSGLSKGSLNPKMFIYYTILSNAVCLIYFIFALIKTTVEIKKSGISGFTQFTRFKGAITMMITVTFLIYHFMLRQGNFTMSSDYNFTADFFVHYFTPLMVIFDWVLFDPKNRYKWYDPFVWLVIPLVYFAFALIRAEVGDVLVMGESQSRYPYFFIDIDKFGILGVAQYVALLVIGFTALGFLIYLADSFHLKDKSLYFKSRKLSRKKQ